MTEPAGPAISWEDTKVLPPLPKVLLVSADSRVMGEARLSAPLFLITYVTSVAKARMALTDHAYELVLIDTALEELTGFHLCKEISLRPEWGGGAVVAICTEEKAPEILLALMSGADDYVTRPLQNKEVQARMDARCHFKPKRHWSKVLIGSLELDRERMSGRFCDQPQIPSLHLTKTEFQILYALARHVDHVVTRDYLLENVWSCDGIRIDSRRINTHMAHLRTKLGPHAHMLRAHYGKGYSLSGTTDVMSLISTS